MQRHDELRTALSEGRICVNEEKIAFLAARLQILGRLYDRRIGEKTDKDELLEPLLKVGAAVARITQLIDGDCRIETTLNAFSLKAVEGLHSLSDATQRAIAALRV